MTVSATPRRMEAFVAFINGTDPAVVHDLIAVDAAFHVPFQHEPLRGPEAYLGILGMMRGGFSDIKWTLEESVVEDDRVAARFRMQGTHDGPFFGIPATGKPIDVQAVNFYRWADGKIAEERGQPDLFGLMQQIGAMSVPR